MRSKKCLVTCAVVGFVSVNVGVASEPRYRTSFIQPISSAVNYSICKKQYFSELLYV
jgi:hypothetical protein